MNTRAASASILALGMCLLAGCGDSRAPANSSGQIVAFRTIYTSLYRPEEPFPAKEISSLRTASTTATSGVLVSLEEGPQYELAKLDDGSTLYQSTVVFGIDTGKNGTVWVVQDRPGALPFDEMLKTAPIGASVALFAVDYIPPGVPANSTDVGEILKRHLLQIVHPAGMLIADSDGNVVPLLAAESSVENSPANLAELSELGLRASSIESGSVIDAG